MHMLAPFSITDDPDADVESLYSVDDDFSPDLLFVLENWEDEDLDTSSPESESDGFDPIYPMASPLSSPNPPKSPTFAITKTPLPQASLSISPTIWDRPIKVIGYFDTDIKEQLLLRCSAENHADFLTKCDHPLWQNPKFFIRLPFQKNEDANPTKASHSGMKPEHLTSAQQEVALLEAQGLIEKTSSPWACEAFYVNKRAEQKRDKLRLIINYQPLNAFLADDKFPLPTRPALLLQLSKAKIFSKFDLKAGFWQLGIHPDNRSKTGFCIPGGQFSPLVSRWLLLCFNKLCYRSMLLYKNKL
ncbi:uncharacterized protein LOC122643869 [Telopea speciosissima]|uniref:uncharacterized protein LOC122643869 n=1 Tax=Telopea speciosissima TaxID=54955 RepID=UPI001CC5AF1E|nr:uncharacterized protein LOC122643869 [Telopea speciosissima]